VTVRRNCPSCQHRLSPLAVECPVCGLLLGQRALPRPLLFQAGAIHGGKEAASPTQAIATPALGRVAPVAVESLPPVESVGSDNPVRTLPPGGLNAGPAAAASTFWLLARLEVGEAILLGLLNLMLGLVVLLLLRVGPGLAYPALWPYLGPLHLAASWTLLMIPLVLVGQSPLMHFLGLRLAAEQPERRMAFSLFHLLSVALFPLSFLCMVLTPNHRSLAELLTGQEILLRG
jgi:hypothetical protein